MSKLLSKKDKQLCKEIIDYYGFGLQKFQLIEEMAELTQAINKYNRFCNGTLKGYSEDLLIDGIFEEIGDVIICLEEVLSYFENCRGVDNPKSNARKVVKESIKNKLKRELERIREMEKGNKCLNL